MEHSPLSDAKNPFWYLDNLLNLLIIEDDIHFSCLLQEIFEPVAVFNVRTASRSGDVLDFIKSGKRVHICILDLGIADIANDEFFILRNYAKNCPVIVLTGSHSPSKGATCVQLGAKTVMEKGIAFSAEKLFDEVVRYCMINIVYQHFNDFATDTVNFAVKTLIEKRPSTVTQWAEYMRITDRQLRNLWNLDSTHGAKFILEVFHIYSAAFAYYKSLLFTRGANPQPTDLRSSAYLETHLKYLYAHLA